jgi:hypothetical protein
MTALGNWIRPRRVRLAKTIVLAGFVGVYVPYAMFGYTPLTPFQGPDPWYWKAVYVTAYLAGYTSLTLWTYVCMGIGDWIRGERQGRRG